MVQYEFAMREICQSRLHKPPYERVNIVKGEPGIQDAGPVPFHPVFLSALLNQQVFRRDVMMQEIRERERNGFYGSDFEVIKAKKEVNQRISDFIKTALDEIEKGEHFANFQTKEERATAWSLYELLEKQRHTWDDEFK